MPGSPKKPSDRRQGHGTADLTPVRSLPATERSVPHPDAGWLAETRRQWADLWASPLADYLRETDEAAVRRCFMWRDELARCQRKARAARREAEKEPLVLGSKEQLVANPMFSVADRFDDRALVIESKIVALEDRLALSPKARLALGVTEQKGVNLAAQNAQIAAALAKAVTDAPDPRAVRRDPTADAS